MGGLLPGQAATHEILNILGNILGGTAGGTSELAGQGIYDTWVAHKDCPGRAQFIPAISEKFIPVSSFRAGN